MGTHRDKSAPVARPASRRTREQSQESTTRPVNIGRRGKLSAIDGSKRHFRIIDEIVQPQVIPEKSSEKLIYLQRMKFEDDGSEQFRFRYYMRGVKSGALGHWVFGQYALFIPAPDLRKLIAAARKKGWKPFESS